jgi:hypothetical protein
MDAAANVILILDRASTLSPQSTQFCKNLSFNSYQLFISYDATKSMKFATLPLKSLLEIQVLSCRAAAALSNSLGEIPLAANPENDRVDALRVPSLHLMIQLLRSLRLRLQLPKSPNIPNRRINIVNPIHSSRTFVGSNNSGGFERSNLLQSSNPRIASLFVHGFSQPLVQFVVTYVACDYHAQIRDVHESRVVCVGMSGFDDVDCVAFEIDSVSFEGFHESRDGLFELAGERRFPPGVVVLGFDLLGHVLNRCWSSNHFGVGEMLEDCGDGSSDRRGRG